MVGPTILPGAGATRALPLTLAASIFCASPGSARTRSAIGGSPSLDRGGVKAARLLHFCQFVNGIFPLGLPIINIKVGKIPLMVYHRTNPGPGTSGAVMMTGSATFPKARATGALPRKRAP
jgi:hypothetical protein